VSEVARSQVLLEVARGQRRDPNLVAAYDVAVVTGAQPERLLSVIRDTLISAPDALRTIGRIAGRLARPWR
jgi:hypothetical protein